MGVIGPISTSRECLGPLQAFRTLTLERRLGGGDFVAAIVTPVMPSHGEDH